MIPFILSLGIALLFYLLIPGFGAIYVRNQWRRFRYRLVKSTLYPFVSYHALSRPDERYLGSFRFIGSLEAIQGKDTVWIRDGRTSLSVELDGVPVYILPSSTEWNRRRERGSVELPPDEMPRQMSWNRVFSLPEGTRIYVSGSLFRENDRTVFRSSRRDPLTVVIFDGDERTIIRRSIWGGRQRNEYWNQFTPISLAVGSFSLVIMAYNLLRFPMLRFPALVALTLSFMPIVPLLPPGVFFMLLYSRLWRRGRILRGERDLWNLPLRYFIAERRNGSSSPPPSEVLLPDGERFAVEAFPSLEEARACAEVSGVEILTSSFKPGRHGPYHLYGSPGRDGRLGASEDPFAAHIIVPGDPVLLSRGCRREAHLHEIFAAVAFTAAVLVNSALVFALLGSWFK